MHVQRTACDWTMLHPGFMSVSTPDSEETPLNNEKTASDRFTRLRQSLGVPEPDEMTSFDWLETSLPIFPGFAGLLVSVNTDFLIYVRKFSFLTECERDMFLNAAGDVYIPIRFYLVVLPSIFLTTLLIYPFLVVLFALRIIYRMITTRQDEGFFSAMYVVLKTLCQNFLFASAGISPLSAWYFIYTGQAHSLVLSNSISGLELWMALLLPVVAAFYFTSQFSECAITKNYLLNALQEFDDMGLYSNKGVNVDVLEVPSEGSVKVQDLKHYLKQFNQTFAYAHHGHPDSPLFLFHFATDIENNFKTIHIRSHGASYAEKWALVLLSLRRACGEVSYSAFEIIASIAAAILLSLVPPCWMFKKHRDSYLDGEDLIIVAISSVVSIFVITFSFTFMATSRLKLFKKVQSQMSAVLLSACTDTARPIIQQCCRTCLTNIYVHGAGNTPYQTFEEMLEYINHEQSSVGLIDEKLIHGLANFNVLQKGSLKARLVKYSGTALMRLHEQNEAFQSLNLDLFVKMRKWMDIELCIESGRLTSMVVSLSLGVAVGVVGVFCSFHIWQSVTACTIFALPFLTLFSLLMVLCLNSLMLTNTILIDTTVKLLTYWVNRLKRVRKDSRTDCKKYILQQLSDESVGKEALARLQLDNYFRELIEPIEQQINEVQSPENSLQVLGVPITIQLRNRAIATLGTVILSGFGKFLVDYQQHFTDAVLKELPLMT